MESDPQFPTELLLCEPNRGARLVQEFYQQYHSTDDQTHLDRQHVEVKAAFYRRSLEALGHNERSLGLDVGCRVGVLIKLVGLIRWLGVDIDEEALRTARESGVTCAQMDFTTAIGFKDCTLDTVMMTEVLEHLPYPSIVVREVHRILKARPSSLYLGSVPLDYHLHRRWKVMRGKRLSGDQTHVHHFSFQELDQLLRHYFNAVEYLPLSGTATRHSRLQSLPNLFVRDIAWVASSPKSAAGPWNFGKM